MRALARRQALVGALVVGLCAAGAGIVLTSRTGADPPLDPGQATGAAASACGDLQRFEELVRVNAPAKDVRAVLARAVRSSRLAADSDPVHLSLAGGAQSLQLALEADDARAARVGIDVVRSACRTALASPGPG